MQNWDNNLWLLTKNEFSQLPDGTELTCIDGTTAVKGQDNIDMDTRYNHIAYGVVDPVNHPLAAQFVFFRLAS